MAAARHRPVVCRDRGGRASLRQRLVMARDRNSGGLRRARCAQRSRSVALSVPPVKVQGQTLPGRRRRSSGCRSGVGAERARRHMAARICHHDCGDARRRGNATYRIREHVDRTRQYPMEAGRASPRILYSAGTFGDLRGGRDRTIKLGDERPVWCKG